MELGAVVSAIDPEGRTNWIADARLLDGNYVAAQSALVWQAIRLTTERIGDPVGDALSGHKWTAEFVRQMDRLAMPLLRQSNNGSAAHNGVQNVGSNGGPVHDAGNVSGATAAIYCAGW